jgi:hypothetical protein
VDNGKVAHTVEQLQTAIKVMAAACEAVREARQIPEGHLYAAFIGKMNIETFEAMMRRLLGTGLIVRDPSRMLRWVGPEVR